MTTYRIVLALVICALICTDICLIYCALDYYGVIDYLLEIVSPSHDHSKKSKKKDSNGKNQHPS
jgi:hypothetical protein